MEIEVGEAPNRYGWFGDVRSRQARRPGRPMAESIQESNKTGLRPSVYSIRYYFILYEYVVMATSYSIGKHFEGFIESLIESGRYSTASEVMRDGLRLIEEREERRQAKLEALRAEIQKGSTAGLRKKSILAR
jgi:antitoxin ParD1/3/4